MPESVIRILNNTKFFPQSRTSLEKLRKKMSGSIFDRSQLSVPRCAVADTESGCVYVADLFRQLKKIRSPCDVPRQFPPGRGHSSSREQSFNEMPLARGGLLIVRTKLAFESLVADVNRSAGTSSFHQHIQHFRIKFPSMFSSLEWRLSWGLCRNRTLIDLPPDLLDRDDDKQNFPGWNKMKIHACNQKAEDSSKIETWKIYKRCGCLSKHSFVYLFWQSSSSEETERYRSFPRTVR